MKIKKVNDKPFAIHIKQKAKIHSHDPKKASIKGSNVYTVKRAPKIRGAIIRTEIAKASNGASKSKKQMGKNNYRNSTIHSAEYVRERGIAKLRRNVIQTNQSINVKQTNINVVGRTGAIGAKAVTDKMEGGREVQQAAYMAYVATRPVTGTALKGTKLLKRQVLDQKHHKIKRVEAGKKLAKRTSKKTAKEATKGTAKRVAKETVKKTVKVTAKTAAKLATTTAITAAGSAVAPGAGTAIGIVAGYAAGIAVEQKDMQLTNRNRKMKFFLDKMKSQENQQDSIVKLMKDLITRRALLWIKTVAPIIGLVLLLLVLVVAMITIPIIAVMAVIYNSPFAIFLPPLEEGDTIQTVTSAYVAEFNRDVSTLANEHTGYDVGQVVYVEYEAMDVTTSNYYDILAVYMVKYGVGDTAIIMNDTSKDWLQSVVDDMCYYTTSTVSETETITNDDGTTTTITTTYLFLNVTLKSYRDMIFEYGFNSDEVEMLEEIMSPEYLPMLG